MKIDQRSLNWMRHAPQEVLGTLMLWFAEYSARRSLFDDMTPINEHDAVCNLAREAHFMSDDHHRHALISQRPHHGQDLADEFRVEC